MEICFALLSGSYVLLSLLKESSESDDRNSEIEKLEEAVKGAEIIKINKTVIVHASFLGVGVGEVEETERTIACFDLENGREHEFRDSEISRKFLSPQEMRNLMIPLGPNRTDELMQYKPSVVNFHTVHPPVYRYFNPQTSKVVVGRNRPEIVKVAAKSKRLPFTFTMFGAFIISSICIFDK